MKKLIFACLILTFFNYGIVRGEENRSMKLFEDAIEAMGGDAFLSVKDMVSKGNYFQFDRHGASSPLIKFTDYTSLPDKSRYELGNKIKELDITVFNLETNEGWILEGQKETKAATADEMREFRNVVKHSLDPRTRESPPARRA